MTAAEWVNAVMSLVKNGDPMPIELADDITLPGQVSRSIVSLPEQAMSLKIADETGAACAADFLNAIKELRRKVDDHYDPIIKAALQSHRAALAAKKEHEVPLQEAEKIVKEKVFAWVEEQNRVKREAEMERLRALREAEEKRLLELAVMAEESGDTETAADMLAQAAAPQVAVLPSAPTKVEGVVLRSTWVGRVDSLQAFVSWINKNPGYETLIEVNQSALNQLARSTKGSLKIDGVVFEEKSSVAATRR